MPTLRVDEELDLDFGEEGVVDAKVSAGVELQAPDGSPAIMLSEVGEDFGKRRTGFATPAVDSSIG